MEHGIPMFTVRGPILMPCPKLDGDRCSIYETRPQSCQDSPRSPKDIEGLPRCSYVFINSITGEVRTGASPAL